MRKKPFRTESKRILDLMINSIYIHKEIFLRELISNSSDAMDKLYFKALSQGETGIDRSNFEIFIEANKDTRTLTIIDNGIGMTKDELENNLGTIAKSGTMDFRQENKDSLQQIKPEMETGVAREESEDTVEEEIRKPPDTSQNTEEETSDATVYIPAKKISGAPLDIDIIGQFGVGFYSAFMVSKRITVISKSYGCDEAWRWQSEGTDGYSIEPDERDGWGTTITLELKENHGEEDYSQYLEQYKIQEIVKKYSDYIRYPIKMETTKSRPKAVQDSDNEKMLEYESYQEIDMLNSMVPLWRRNKNEIQEEDYWRFYMEKFHDYENPLTHIHISTEGLISYNGILYIPASAPYNYYSKEYEKGLQLYANGVLIMEKCSDLLSDCFSFVRGLVDSPDLSLNISREMLQQNRQVKAIAKSLDKRIKTELLKLQKDDREKYEVFFNAFSLRIKFGIYDSFGTDKEKLQELLLYYSLKEDKMVTLAEYKEKMTKDQEAIYYACASSTNRVRQLPQTELVLDKGYDILALTDDVDEFAIKVIQEYQGKPIKSVSDKELGLESNEEKEFAKEQAEEYKDLLISMKDALGDKVKEVRLSKRLKSYPVCLTSDGPLSLEMEKVLNSMPIDQQVKADQVLEINNSHPVFEALTKLAGTNPEKLKTYTMLLYNQALLIEGITIEDPVSFVNAICELMH